MTFRAARRSGVTLPVHYGHLNQVWPPGVYWLVEHVRQAGFTLYWSDATDDRPVPRTGWTYSPFFAAGFASEQDCRDAYAQRGAKAVGGGEIRYCLHVWS